MSTPLLDMIRGILPNFADKQLRKMVPWFEAVSNGVNQSGTFIAAAQVDVGGNISRSFGITGPVEHPSTGNFTLTLTRAGLAPTNLWVAAFITNQLDAADSYVIYPRANDTSQVSVSIQQEGVLVDHDFVVMVYLTPSDTSAT